MSTPRRAVAARALVASLTPEERAKLPSHLRALLRDELAEQWNAAKAKRDKALAALTDENGRYTDADAVLVVKAQWAARKAELLARQPAEG